MELSAPYLFRVGDPLFQREYDEDAKKQRHRYAHDYLHPIMVVLMTTSRTLMVMMMTYARIKANEGLLLTL